MKKIWKGYYCYSFDTNEAQHGFEIDANFDGQSFQGMAFEEEFSGFTGDKAKVEGFVDVDYIRFVISYPYNYQMDENGNIQVDKTKPGHEVVYEGYLNSETLFWEGEWEILLEQRNVPGSEDLFEEEVLVGPWKMKLVQN